MVREKVEQVPLPEGVRFKQMTLGSDWEGDPAWRIVLTVAKETAWDKPLSGKLIELSHEVANRVSDLHFDTFPFVHFERLQ